MFLTTSRFKSASIVYLEVPLLKNNKFFSSLIIKAYNLVNIIFFLFLLAVYCKEYITCILFGISKFSKRAIKLLYFTLFIFRIFANYHKAAMPFNNLQSLQISLTDTELS